MLSEIYARGPIACTIAVTSAFEQYTGGVFNDTTGAKVQLIMYLMYYLLPVYLLYSYWIMRYPLLVGELLVEEFNTG
uniref:Uncharacterized protein n=1 Tax=Amphimedon queenslandica TaxID=400682 RepID=A0A1X7SGW5_AMPQE